jgi:hypothetical protein
MRLTEGQRIKTPLGPGRIISFEKARDSVPPHGKPVRGVAYALVELDRPKGQRRYYQAGELKPLDG